MATLYDYRWYNDGRYLAILQRQTDSVYDPYLSLNDDLFATPETDDSSAIYVRYTVTQTAPNSETDDDGLPLDLSLAVVHYIKARLAEENGDEGRQMINMKEFYKYLSRNQNNKKGGPRVVSPGYSGAVIKTTWEDWSRG